MNSILDQERQIESAYYRHTLKHEEHFVSGGHVIWQCELIGLKTTGDDDLRCNQSGHSLCLTVDDSQNWNLTNGSKMDCKFDQNKSFNKDRSLRLFFDYLKGHKTP